MGIDVKPFTANIEVVINNDMLADKISKLQNELTELEAEKARLNSLVSELQGENAELQAQIIQVDNKINQLTNELNALNGEVVNNPGEYALGTKNAIANAIKGKGGTITEETTFRAYADEIDKMSIKKTGDPHTLLLMHFTESAIKDDSINDCQFTIKGNPIITTEQSKFGGGSLYLDGASCLTFERNYFPIFTPQFTFEFWWRVPDNYDTYNERFCIFSQNGTFPRESSGTSGECFNQLEIYQDRYFQEYRMAQNQRKDYTAVLSLNYGLKAGKWCHIAIVRDYNRIDPNYLFYFDGQQATWMKATNMGQTAYTGAVMSPWNQYPIPPTLFAFRWESGSTGRYMEGHINELRISDVARYSGDSFTPPTEPFTI